MFMELGNLSQSKFLSMYHVTTRKRICDSRLTFDFVAQGVGAIKLKLRLGLEKL
jgi:hypothetical protein